MEEEDVPEISKQRLRALLFDKPELLSYSDRERLRKSSLLIKEQLFYSITSGVLLNIFASKIPGFKKLSFGIQNIFRVSFIVIPLFHADVQEMENTIDQQIEKNKDLLSDYCREQDKN